jgi:PAS domain S-box-containing protein
MRRRREDRLLAANEELRASARLFHEIFQYAQVGLCLVDSEATILRANPQFSRIFGYEPEELEGQNVVGFFPEQVRPGLLFRFRAMLDGENAPADWQVQNRAGQKRSVRVCGLRRFELEGQRFLLGSFLDITEQVEAEERRNQEARRKDEFLAMLSHELRNPLGAIISAAALLQRLGLSDPTLQMARDIIERQAAHLTRIVDDLLDVSRITRGTITIQKKRISAGDAIALAAETIRPTLEPRGQKLLLSLTPVPVEAVADASRLAQAIGNLLHNASKYSRDGGRIWLSLQTEGEEAVIRVRDEGLGIPAGLLPRVFEPFVQGSWVLDSSLDQSHRGLGVGLTLVRSIVELHGGSVEAASEGPGRGSEFTIRLPAMPRGGKESGSGGVREAQAPAAASARRIPVVDDSIDFAAGVARLLDMSGYQVRTAHDGESALSAAAEFHPEVVLLDIGLPDIDGYETARRIRQIPGLSAVDLVALTGYGQASDRRRAREAGFDRHIVKPVSADELLRLIRTPEHA